MLFDQNQQRGSENRMRSMTIVKSLLFSLLMLGLLQGVAVAQDGYHAPATVNVAHFAPFGADVDGTSVTVKVSGEGVDAALEMVKFGDIVDVFAIGLLPDDPNFPLQATSTTGLPMAADASILAPSLYLPFVVSLP